MMKTLEAFKAVYALPLPELILKAAEIARANRPGDIQRCALLSIKTGGCPEDCGYCSQSARYDTPVNAEPLMSVEEVRKRATEAKLRGATRFCMGAAWRSPKDGPQFDSVIEMKLDEMDGELRRFIRVYSHRGGHETKWFRFLIATDRSVKIY